MELLEGELEARQIDITGVVMRPGHNNIQRREPSRLPPTVVKAAVISDGERIIALTRENAELRELVIQLSKLVIKNVVEH